MTKETIYLTTSQVLFIHSKSIKRYGGSAGIRDLGLLESALARPQASFGGKDLYPDIFNKASVLLESLIKNHPFIDGNKRTALSSSALFLKRNGYKLLNSHREEIEFTLKIAKESASIDEISKWLQEHSIYH